MSTPLIKAIEATKQLAEADKTKVKGGKFYTTVPTRVEMFREALGEDSQIVTEIVEANKEFVMVKATISIFADGDWRLLATGHAEEYRANGPINATSALENCETSAIGRALAACGIHGGEFASSFEVDNAKNNKPVVLQAQDKEDDHADEAPQLVLITDKQAAHLKELLEEFNSEQKFLDAHGITCVSQVPKRSFEKMCAKIEARNRHIENLEKPKAGAA